MRINIPVNVKLILDRLGEAGFAAYCVGGCVRDAVLGKAPQDWDITTSALPGQVKEVFADLRTVDTGIKHGTVTVLIDHTPYEVTTFRVDGSYSDNRHPDSVSFSADVRDDLSRRDFTVNAMAYNGDGLVDCFGGMEDIAAGVIRCVGDGDRRFTEDALRIMRALRFSSTLGFEIEPGTRASLLAKKELLKNIAAERITSELLKLICGTNFKNVFSKYYNVIFTALPALGELYRSRKDFGALLARNLEAASLLPADAALRLAAIVSFPTDETYPEPVDAWSRGEASRAVLRGMRLSNKFSGRVCCLAGHRSAELGNETDVKYCAGRIGYDNFFDLMKLRMADARAAGDAAGLERLLATDAFARELREKGACLSLCDLKIDGDLLTRRFGLQGVQIGVCLDELLRAVIEGKVQNTASELTKYAEKLISCTDCLKI